MTFPAHSPQARRAGRIESLFPIEYPADLPVVLRRDELAQAIREHQVVIVCGETGSGKTTQLPKICLGIGRGVQGMIAHTQPRRVAARSVASRIAHELKTELGGAVGYKIRFNDKVSADTCIKLMTDGILLAEVQGDPGLNKYDTIIIDEAHERSLNIDFLLGYFKQLLPRRPDLKLIITSATLDAERFARHFGNAPVIQVSGRSYPVEVRYRPLQQNEEGDLQDVTQAVCTALDELSTIGLRGDVLVFLPGEREIRDTAEALRKHHPKGVEILPLFSRLSAAEQDRVFKPASGMRRVVLATNVAETSLTVPNIAYVIDSGLARINRYSIRQKVEQLRVEKISRAAASQRAGRCGRVMSGICVRLYDEAEFLARNEYTDAEIFRVSLATVILRMSALNLGSDRDTLPAKPADSGNGRPAAPSSPEGSAPLYRGCEVAQFPFIEPPGSRSIADGYHLLAELNAIDEKRQLTPLGRELAKLPLDPKIARLLLAGKQYHCLQEILIIASALSVQDPRDRPPERREAADMAHQRFNDERSDFLAYLKLWAWFQQAVKHKKSNRSWANECRESFLSPLRLREWHELYQQLHAQVAEMGMRLNEQAANYEQIHKSLLTGLLGNIGCKSVYREAYYLGAREIKYFIAPNSVLAKKGAKWVVAAELTETTKLYARCVARIEAEWLEEVGAHLIKRHYYDPHWEKKAAQVAAWERSTLYGLIINPKKRVHYGPMNVAESREVFIRQALVAGEFNTHAPFFAHNQKLIRDIEALEHKARRPDVLVDEELIFAFYDSRIPDHLSGQHIHNGAAFEAWRKEAEREKPKLLFLQRDDLMRHEAAGITTDQFPPQLVMNNISYTLAYHFAPGKSDDGVMLTVPLALINQVSAQRCEYLVPGLLAEKVAQLVKTLPQKLRRHLVPVPEFAAAFCRDVEPSDMPLLQAMARYIRAQKQLEAPLDAFRPEQLPLHLLMNFYVADEHGRQLGVSRNFTQLRTELAPKAEPSLAKTEDAGQSKVRFTEWSFGEFKDISELRRAGQTVTLFNALADEGDAVTLRAYDTREEAQAAHRSGLRRLFMLAMKEQVRFLEKNLPGLQAMAMQFLPFGSQQDLLRQILSVTFDRCCLMEPWPGSEKEFVSRCKEAKSRLTLVAQEIARLAGAILSEHQLAQKNLQSCKVRPRDGAAEPKGAGATASRRLPQTAGFASNVSKAHTQAAQDMREQCAWMLRKEFIANIPYERLQHLPRYLKAINVRVEKLRADAARDARLWAQLHPLQQAWQRNLSGQQGKADVRLEEFGWLLQELRVSLFAQDLKTPVIVSVKRLEKLLATLGS